MCTINKQKFLAELAKLLTFMYEEDRQLALGAYTKMFDDAEDEQALLQALVSPLRQAVEVARAYNAGSPNLARASAAEASEDELFAFMDTITRIREEAFRTQPVREEEPEPQPEPEPEPAPVEELAEEEGPVVDENQMSLFDEEEPAEGEEAAAPEGEEAAEEAPAEEEFKLEVRFDDDKPAPQPAARAAAPASPEPEVLERPNVKTVRKPRTALLILYAPIAVILGLAGTALLLIPALASLIVGAACISVAAMIIVSSIGAFATIANLLVAIGAALILLAVGLVFLMLFVWFIGGAIAGLVRGLISLGRKWCYKEVPAK